MIPTIGVMIGAYIITRMLRLIVNTKDEHWLVIGFAIATIIVALFGIWDLQIRGNPSNFPTQP